MRRRWTERCCLIRKSGVRKRTIGTIQAEDGTGNWINGLIDQNSRVIALDFRILDDQSAVNVKLKLADEWAKPIDPLTTDAVLDLSSGITRIKVNDGADDIEYTIFSTSTQLLRGVTATCNTEQVSANFINGIASLRFKQNTAFANVVLMRPWQITQKSSPRIPSVKRMKTETWLST